MSKHSKNPVEGLAVFQRDSISGYITLRENLMDNSVKVSAHLSGLPPNQEIAWHIHEAGDLRDAKCMTACAHYNPHNKKHGGAHDKERHVGDLGNLRTNAQGESRTTVTVKDLKLRGKYSVIGRSLVIHALKDDLGKAGTKESETTGSAGARIGCAVIGYSEKSQLYF